MYTRLLSHTKSNSFFLFGARGTGKSTLLEAKYPKRDYFWIDLLLPATEEKYLLHPDRLLEQYLALKEKDRPRLLVIDEVQKVPKILDVVHAMIEKFKCQFVLTGSSARKLKTQGANLLAARAFEYTLYPFSLFELKDDFDLMQALNFGLLPKIWELADEEDKKDYLRSYVQKYLKEEIQMEQLVRDMVPFRKFLEVAAQSNSEIINYSKLGRQCGVDYKSVMRYFEILRDTFVGVFLDCYHRSVRVRQIQSPKFYFFDTGVLRALTLSLNHELNPGNFYYGKMFETFVIMEFFKLNSYLKKDYKLSYLKTHEGAEIDLIVENSNGKVWLLEIKSSKEVFAADCKSLVHFAPLFSKPKLILISQSVEKRKLGNVYALPIKAALKEVFEI
jgi:predicted AAA+ superfamily ATPase